jgi:hypothetical protein
MDSLKDTPKGVGCPIRRSQDQQLLALPLSFSQRATSFIASRCQGIHQMPFLRARPRPAPSTHVQGSENRGQTTDQTSRRDPLTCRPRRPFCSLVSVTWSLEPRRKPPRLAPWRSHTHARIRPDGRGRTRFTVSRLASRCQRSDVREQRTDRTTGRSCSLQNPKEAGVRGQRSTLLPSDRRGPDQTPREPGPAGPVCPLPLSSVLCPLSSDLRLSGGPGPTRTADLTLIRRAL